MKPRFHFMLLGFASTLLGGGLKAEPQMLNVKHTYSGIINVQSFDPKTYAEVVNDSPMVVTNDKEYRAFVGRIPTKEVSKSSDSTPSKDPLLARVVVDFKKDMMVVLICSSSMHDLPNIPQIMREKAKIVVQTSKQLAKAPVMSQPIGLGAYRAFILPKLELPVEFEKMGAKAYCPK